jgi:phage terminase large subunit
MLYGDWDAFEGQYFPEFSREKHVCRPFEIPSDWNKFIAFDYGLDMTACLWFAFPPDKKRLYVYRELYRPNMILSEAAKEIIRLTGEEKIRFAVASPDLAGRRQDSGKTGFNLMATAGLAGVTPANNNRIAGWRMIRELLIPDDEGTPRILFFENCLNIIRTLPRLTFDERIPEDVSSTPHELTHAPDALRYGVLSIPFMPGDKPPSKKGECLDPYEEFRETKRYDYLKFLTS